MHLAHHVVEQLLFLAQFLGALGVVPDLGVLEFAVQFFESSFLEIDVKDTSEVRPDGARGRRCWSG